MEFQLLEMETCIYVCDSENHCIHILNQYLRLVKTISSQGTAPGKFNWPDNIAFDSSGQFYVTECRNHIASSVSLVMHSQNGVLEDQETNQEN